MPAPGRRRIRNRGHEDDTRKEHGLRIIRVWPLTIIIEGDKGKKRGRTRPLARAEVRKLLGLLAELI